MPHKNQPWSSCSVDRFEVVIEKLILRRGGVEEMLRAHQHKMGTPVVKTIPAETEVALVFREEKMGERV